MVNLQFITHQTPHISYIEGAQKALAGGCRWVQMRLKGEPRPDDLSPLECATALKALCATYKAKLIIDDNVELAHEIHADGVHLGRNDMPIAEARRRLGANYLIGGTANTADDIRRIAAEGADYIGCGPFRFTTTKQNLAPSLGIEGYVRLLSAMRREGIRLPLIAIGGVTERDVRPLLDAGVDGIAVSGTILNAADPVEATCRLLACDEADTPASIHDQTHYTNHAR